MTKWHPHIPNFYDILEKTYTVALSDARIDIVASENDIHVFLYDEEEEIVSEVDQNNHYYAIGCAIDYAEDYGKVITEQDAIRIGDFFRWNNNAFADWDTVARICGIKDEYRHFPYDYTTAKKNFENWKSYKKFSKTFHEGAD
jgi:hypothetical protein|tara:strand:+ start:1283 stop:1711 length:429 start_codon:yes stop_codon:yes gene_type:complete